MLEVSLFSSPSPGFIVCILYGDGYSGWCEVILHFYFICISLIISHDEHHFMFFLAVCLWRNANKIKMQYHLTPARIAITIKYANNKSWSG